MIACCIVLSQETEVVYSPVAATWIQIITHYELYYFVILSLMQMTSVASRTWNLVGPVAAHASHKIKLESKPDVPFLGV
jgi:hypothetical protein